MSNYLIPYNPNPTGPPTYFTPENIQLGIDAVKQGYQWYKDWRTSRAQASSPMLARKPYARYYPIMGPRYRGVYAANALRNAAKSGSEFGAGAGASVVRQGSSSYTRQRRRVYSKKKGRMITLYTRPLKYSDDAVGPTLTLGQWTWHFPTSNIAQGTTSQTRIGNQIILKDITIRGILQLIPPGTASRAGNFVVGEVVLLIDKQANKPGAPPSTSGANIFQSSQPTAFRDLDYANRYSIIYRQTFNMSNPNTSGDGLDNRLLLPFNIHKKMNLLVNYDGLTGAYSEITNNVLWMGVFLWDGSGSGSTVTIEEYNARTRFKDLDR